MAIDNGKGLKIFISKIVSFTLVSFKKLSVQINLLRYDYLFF